ncbi:MAG: prepilin-type N-terminal cleavage/methylation domain-containing protein [Porticoccaceae bacterium]|nr:prepilin-type N-terminal cleavage/methylation domain-containing protein [Porticoccaceae bacterium]
MLVGINNFHSRSSYKTRFRNTKVRGFTLIEVLVTLQVFSVGLLGYAALQSRVVKAQLEVYQQVPVVAIQIMAGLPEPVGRNLLVIECTR